MPEVLSVAAAVRNELDQLGLNTSTSALGATALALAVELDDAEGPRDKAAVGRELRAVLADIHRMTPEPKEVDEVDELAYAREQRRRSAGTAADDRTG